MKIALLASDMKVNGVSHFVLSLAEALLNGDNEVIVVTTYTEATPFLSAQNFKIKHIASTFLDSRVSHALRLAHYLRREKFDIVVSNIGWLNWVGHYCLRFLSNNTGNVLVLHNHYEKVYQAARISYDACRIIVAVSPRIFSTVSEYFPKKTIRLIPYGVRCPTHQELEQRIQFSIPIRLLYVGRLQDSQKGIFLIPCILEECSKIGLSFTLTIIGDGADRGQLESILRTKELWEFVNFTGVLSTHAVYSEMRRHHILLLPSYFEGSPLVLLEAQANGCVPIASNLAGVTNEAIAEGETGLLAPVGDTQAFAICIKKLIDSDTWHNYSNAGIARATTLFSRDKMWHSYLQLFTEFTKQIGCAQQSTCSYWIYLRVFKDCGWRDFFPTSLRLGIRRLKRVK